MNNKFTRFIGAMVLYIMVWTFMFCVIPTFAMIFGGSFIEVAQCPPYIALMVIVGNIALGIIFHNLFDSDIRFHD